MTISEHRIEQHTMLRGTGAMADAAALSPLPFGGAPAGRQWP